MQYKVQIRLIVILIVLSILINIKLITKEYHYFKWKSLMTKTFSSISINNNKLDKEIKNFSNNKKYKYLYFSSWETFCSPCIKEMPLLDSIFSKYNSKIACYFISDITKDTAIKKRLKIKHFEFLYSQNNIISAIHNHFSIKTKTYPLNLLIDTNLKIYYFSNSAIESKEKIKLIESLKCIK